jgi:hypothetical protein
MEDDMDSERTRKPFPLDGLVRRAAAEIGADGLAQIKHMQEMEGRMVKAMPDVALHYASRAVPFLAFTRKHGWIVVVPWPGENETNNVLGHIRPGAARVWRHDVLATAPLPPVPESAA